MRLFKKTTTIDSRSRPEEIRTAFKHEIYQSLCEAMRQALTEEVDAKNRVKKLKDQIIEMSGGDRSEFGIKVAYRTRKGSVDYMKLLKSLISDEEIDELIENYRKDEVKFWEVKSY